MPFVKSAHQDAALNSLAGNIVELWLCPSEPADYAAANTAKLVVIAVAAGDLTLAAGDVDGRKLRFAGKSGLASGSGTVTRAVFVNTTNQTIEFVNNIASTTVASGGQVNVNAFDIWEVGNPS